MLIKSQKERINIMATLNTTIDPDRSINQPLAHSIVSQPTQNNNISNPLENNHIKPVFNDSDNSTRNSNCQKTSTQFETSPALDPNKDFVNEIIANEHSPSAGYDIKDLKDLNENGDLHENQGTQENGTKLSATNHIIEPIVFYDISDNLPAIKIGSFGCISMDNNSLWEKQTETFDLIAKSLPQDHLGTSESTYDIPRVCNLEEFVVHPSKVQNLNHHQSSHRSASDVSHEIQDAGSSSNIFPLSNEECVKGALHRLSVENIPNGRQHSAGDLNSKDLANSKKSTFFRRSPKLYSLISLGVNTTNVRRNRKPASIFGSAFFLSNTSSNRSSKSNLIVAEAQCLVPSIANEYFIDDLGSSENIQNLEATVPSNFTSKFRPFLKFRPFIKSTASLQDKLNNLESSSADFCDNVIDINEPRNMKRSLSVPPKYEYHEQTHNLKIEPVENQSSNIDSSLLDKNRENEELEDILGNLRTPGKSSKTGKKGGKWQKTMPDLIEGPESETLTSQSSARILLAKTALAIIKGDYDKKSTKSYKIEDEEEDLTETEIELANKLEIKKYKKNLLVISIGFFSVFTAYLSLRNLQSSLNSKSGLGLYALSALYGCFVIGCILATTVVQRLRPKISMIIACFGLLTYDLANMMPCFETMIPASCIVGLSLGILWTAHNTYLANMAVGYAELTGIKVQDALSKFNGTFFVFYHSSQIVGGLLSSLVLNMSFNVPLNDTFQDLNSINNTLIYNDAQIFVVPNNIVNLENITLNKNVTDNLISGEITLNISDLCSVHEFCGSNYCPKRNNVNIGNITLTIDKKSPSILLVKILVGFYTGCSILGILILIFFLDRLEGSIKKPKTSLPRQLMAVFTFYIDLRSICLLGMMIYSLLQSAFMFGEFTKSFVTCVVGVEMVGYVMVCLSASSAICSFLNQQLQKRIGRNILVFIAVVLQSTMLITMMLWRPSDKNWPILFLIAVVWGLGDGVIITQTISLVGFLFSDNKEPAFAALKMTQSGTNFIFFFTSSYVCTKFKILALFTILMFASAGYICLIRLLKARKNVLQKNVIISEKEIKSGTENHNMPETNGLCDTKIKNEMLK